MIPDLAPYRSPLLAGAPALADTLDATVQEAARVLSPAGMEAYLEGAVALAGLGKGGDLVTTYLEAMPQVARECGEDVVPDCVGAVMKLSSMTSGEVLTLTFATLPTAARRLGDAEMLRGYLALLHRLSAKAPRGLRPMLGRLDELLAKLTLSGLRRWADFGAEAYGRDLTRQAAFFGLESEDSKAVLQKERRGTLFVDSQRRLNFYLMAFWGRAFFLRPAAADVQNFRPFIEDRALHLPDAVDAVNGVRGMDVYRAMAAHMAAHIAHTPARPDGAGLAPAQRFLVGLVEDARVEALAAREFPGLRRLWRSLLPAAPEPHAEHATMPLLERFVAVLLADGEAATGDAELDALVARFRDALKVDAVPGVDLSRDLGLALHDLLSDRRALPSLRILETLRIPYRDDNRFLWGTDAVDWQDATAWVPERRGQVRRRVGLMEFVNEIDTETAGDDAQEIWTLDGELFPYEDDGVSYNEREGRPPVSEPVHYPEWDYQVQLYRPNWATLYERRQPRGNPEVIDAVLTAHKGVSQRIRRIVDRLRPQGIVRQRRLEDGDDLDINAAVDAMVMLRLGRDPDPRITQRWVINRRDLCALVLLDLSASTNDPVRGAAEGRTVLDLTREACALVATAVSGIGDPFAIHGFASDGRHDVQYYRFKDFHEPFEDAAKSRLAGMSGGLSTRMGTALRHAGHHLRQRPEKHRLLLVLTDGEPADIDERDPQYLRHDARKAVEDLRAGGVQPYCLTLDPMADRYVERIFGAHAYTIVDRVQRLPEKLPTLFAALTR